MAGQTHPNQSEHRSTVRALPCQLPSRLQFAFGLQNSRATTIGFNVKQVEHIQTSQWRKDSQHCRNIGHTVLKEEYEPFLLETLRRLYGVT